MRPLPIRAVTGLFLDRQHLDRPRGRRLTARTLTAFVEDTGGLQLDSINVLERAHYLTAWSRFGAFDPAALDRLVWRKHVLFEYWAHAACMVPRAHLAAWRRAMLDYTTRDTGWSKWLRTNRKVVNAVEAAIRDRGPLANSDFREQRPAGAAGWWNWKPATHALHYLWMTGRTLVHSRVHFQKRFDLAERVLPELATLEPLSSAEFARWHVRRSLRAMGAATEIDLRLYLTFPRTPSGWRRRALAELLKTGEVVEVPVEGSKARWVALAEDVAPLAAAGRRRAPPRGTTLLAPFDSLLWHRDRVKRLFGFDYTIEVYTPGHKRVHGYYTLPVLHDGRLIGRVDAKTHRKERRLEVRNVHFEDAFVAGTALATAAWEPADVDAGISGIADALRSLAGFVGADTVTLSRTSPAQLRERLTSALEA